MSAALAGLIVSGIAAGANMAYQRYQAKKDNEEFDRRQSELYRMSQDAQRNAAANEVAGLKLAGLSPVLANGSAAATVPSAPAPQREPVKLETAALANLAVQTSLIEAQAQKTKAETAEINQRVGEKQTAGMTWSHNLERLYSQMADRSEKDEDKAYYESMANEAREAGQYATAAGDALKGFQQLEAEGYESRERILRSRVGALVAESQFNEAAKHSDFLEALRELPARESNKVVAEIAKFGADKENLEALKSLATSQTELNQAQKRQVEAMAEKLESYNLPSLLKKGDYRGFAAAIIGLLIEGVSHKGL